MLVTQLAVQSEYSLPGERMSQSVMHASVFSLAIQLGSYIADTPLVTVFKGIWKDRRGSYRNAHAAGEAGQV
jgi:hypothetical protein